MVYFRKALKAGNLARAAQELNVAATALGLQIRNLEDELGVPLLERHSRGVVATDAGAVLDLYAADILAKVEAAKVAVRARAQTATHTLNIGLTPSIVRLVGSEIYTELAPMLPRAEITIVEEFSFILSRRMERGELSCALTFSSSIDTANFTATALLEEDLYLLTAANNDDLPPGPITFRDAVRRDLALAGEKDTIMLEVNAIAARRGIDLNIAYVVQSIRAVKNLVAKGVAATIMPYGAADAEIRQGIFIARPIVSPPVIRTLNFVTPKERGAAGLGPEIDAFAGAIADLLHQAEGPITRRL